MLIATLAAAFTAELFDMLFAAVTARIRGRSIIGLIRTLEPTSSDVRASLRADGGRAHSGLHKRLSSDAARLFFIPALAAQRLFGMYRAAAGAGSRPQEGQHVVREALVATLEKSDQYTAGHSKAVAIYARDIAERMGLSADVQERTYLCGLVHDIGKVGLPASLLLKDGPLTLEERRQMQEHPAIGESILNRVDLYADVALVVRHHHERVDGEGYPDRLAGDEIPQLSRIIAVADAYNAMTSNRSYRDAMPTRVARLRLAQAVESQFDTSAVAAFEAILAGATDDYRTAKRADFEPTYSDDAELLAGTGEGELGAGSRVVAFCRRSLTPAIARQRSLQSRFASGCRACRRGDERAL